MRCKTGSRLSWITQIERVKPSIFNVDPNLKQASKEWRHWYCTFSIFVDSFHVEPAISSKDKFKSFIAHISKNVYDYVSKCLTYQEVMQTLERLNCNIICARHLPMTCKQQQGQLLDSYLQKLKQLEKDCIYWIVTTNTTIMYSNTSPFVPD